jgi:gluconokinase
MTDPFPGASVVMGVCGCGKSTIGQGIAAGLGLPFLEGDALHPAANVAKMAAGIPLDDADRWPWLDQVGRALGQAVREHGGAVAACSALKRAYRDQLRAAAAVPIRFLCLVGPREVIVGRMAARTDHFMPLDLLESQLAILELPTSDEHAVLLDLRGTGAELIELAVSRLRSQA